MPQRFAGVIACVFVLGVFAMGCSRSRSSADDDDDSGRGGHSGNAGAKAIAGGRSGSGGTKANAGGSGTGAGGSSGSRASAGARSFAGDWSVPMETPDGGPGSVFPVNGGYCCVPEKQPNCCMVYGGFTEDGSGCGRTCDGMPSPSEAWLKVSDVHGCEMWVEPLKWTDCCGCPPAGRVCDVSGTWKLSYDELPCGAREETVTISLGDDNDGGAGKVVFKNRAAPAWQCDGEDQSTYEATVEASTNGCQVTLRSNAQWCEASTPQCEDLKMTLYFDSFGTAAAIEGTLHTCACDGNDMTTPVYGKATRM